MKIKNLKLLFTLIFFSQVVFSQKSTAQEINNISQFNGWENLIWGSTELEVKQKYENQLTILNPVSKYGNGEYYCPFEIQNFAISHIDSFTVSFLFDEKTKKLARVNLTKENPKNILFILQDLISSLSEKYGKPQIIEETPEYKVNWHLQELDIEIKYLNIKVLDKSIMNSVIISYDKKKQIQQTNSNTAKLLKQQVEIQQIEVPVYKLFPTENYWTYIKLDTRNGKMWQVHFSVSKDGFQGEKELNSRRLILSEEEINGRFTLIPTKNIYNFLLLDQLTGKTYQVQWNNEFLNRLVIPIL
jgi:hypothetical protein